MERVLSVARIDEAPRFAEANPAEIVRSAVALLAPRAERRAVTLESAVDDLPAATWEERRCGRPWSTSWRTRSATAARAAT